MPISDQGAGLDAGPRPTPSAGPVEVAVAELDAPGTDQALGRATVARSGPQTVLSLDLPEVDPQDGYLEVWLIDREGNEMVAVGVVGDSWEPRFSIPKRLLKDGYVIVDVSRQSFDEGPEHSGDTVMRGAS